MRQKMFSENMVKIWWATLLAHHFRAELFEFRDRVLSVELSSIDVHLSKNICCTITK